MSDNTQQLRLDIVSDVVCPWCIVGFLQLQQALREAELAADVHWQPFELNPAMAAEGEHLDSCLLYTSPSPRDATLSRMPSSA